MSEEKEFAYVIDEKLYVQRPLVLGQIRQLMNLMKGIIIPHGIDTMGLVSLLGDKLPLAVAIIITPEGMSLKDKDINTLAAEIDFEMHPETAIQVIEDFFTCNPIPSLLERIGSMAGKISNAMMKETGLSKSASSSPEETSPKETSSSGVTR